MATVPLSLPSDSVRLSHTEIKRRIETFSGRRLPGGRTRTAAEAAMILYEQGLVSIKELAKFAHSQNKIFELGELLELKEILERDRGDDKSIVSALVEIDPSILVLPPTDRSET